MWQGKWLGQGEGAHEGEAAQPQQQGRRACTLDGSALRRPAVYVQCADVAQYAAAESTLPARQLPQHVTGCMTSIVRLTSLASHRLPSCPPLLCSHHTAHLRGAQVEQQQQAAKHQAHRLVQRPHGRFVQRLC